MGGAAYCHLRREDVTQRILVALGRVHAYEGHDLADVVHPVRSAISLAGTLASRAS